MNGDFSQGLKGWKADPNCFKVVDGSLRLDDPLHCTKAVPLAVNDYKVPPGRYTLSGEIRTLRIQGAPGVRLNLFWGGGTQLVKGTTPWTSLEAKDATVAAGTSAVFRVESYGKPSGVAWFRHLRLYRHQPPPLSVFMLYPNYRGLIFSDRSQTAVFDLRVRDSQARYVALEVDGKVGQELPVRPSMQARISLAQLPDGPHKVTAELLDSAHHMLFAQSPYRVVKIPAATRSRMKAWIDANNQAHFIDGKAHFVLGMYDTTGFYGTVGQWEPELASIAQAPINMIINYYVGNAPVSSIESYTTAMANYGMVFLPTVNTYYAGRPDWPKGVAKFFGATTSDQLISDYTSALASDPGVVGYYVQDEPATTLQSETFHQYQLIKQNDPGGFTLAVLNNAPAFSYWRDSVDVIGIDPYPLWGRLGNNLAQVADVTGEAVAAVHGARPVWNVIQFFQGNTTSAWPTEQQLHDMSWMAITAGAEGLFYWSHGVRALYSVSDWPWTASHQYYMNQLIRDSNGNIERVLTAGVSGTAKPVWPKSLGASSADGAVRWEVVALNRSMKDFLYGELIHVTKGIKALEPVLLSPDRRILASNSAEGKVFTRQKNLDGVRYLFAYNHSANPVSATFTLASGAATVTAANENAGGKYDYNSTRQMRLSGQSFKDTFAPYQTHVYQIK